MDLRFSIEIIYADEFRISEENSVLVFVIAFKLQKKKLYDIPVQFNQNDVFHDSIMPGFQSMSPCG